MKDIYSLLNSVKTEIEDLERVEMTALEKKRVFRTITGKRKIKKRWRGIAAAAGITLVCMGMMGIPTVRASILSYFNGNTASDYKEVINEAVKNDTTELKVLSVSRSLGEVTIKCRFEFDRDVSALEEECAYANMPEGNVLITQPFDASAVFVDGYNLADYDEACPVWFMSCRNTEISGNTLTQTIILSLRDRDYDKNLDISLRYRDIKVAGEVIEGEWNYDYTLEAEKYTQELTTNEMGITATDACGFVYTMDNFAVTPNGLKIFGTDGWDADLSAETEFPCLSTMVRILVKDDLGNEYLMYPRMLNYPADNTCVFEIYRGPAVTDDDYLTEWAPEATKLTVAYQQILTTWQSNLEFSEEVSIISEEYVIDLSGEDEFTKQD
jgi:hypothetical protein